MRVQLQVDGIQHGIETRDPETLARWLIEWFDAIDWHPSTWCQVTVWPTWTHQGDTPDWITDSRYAGLLPRTENARTPEDMVKALTECLQTFREETGAAGR